VKSKSIFENVKKLIEVINKYFYLSECFRKPNDIVAKIWKKTRES